MIGCETNGYAINDDHDQYSSINQHHVFLLLSNT